MKQASKNDADILNLINKLQEQLGTLERKIDTLINRSASETKPKSSVNTPMPQAKPNVQNNARPKYTAICADCNKECTIPFKPSGDRPVYCQDCFSRRKVIRLSKIGIEEKPKETVAAQAPINQEVIAPKVQSKSKKKAAPLKKAATKKKTVTKKSKKR